MNIATRIMTVWATDSRYSTGGVPQPLAQKGGADSLEGLISEHVGDIPTGAVIAELNRVKALQEESDGKVRLVQRSFLPPGLNDEKLRILGNQFSDLGSSVLFNLDEVKQSRMQRYVVNDRLPKHLVPKFQELATALAQALLEQLDSWLSEHEQSASQTKPVQQTARTGLGVYFFENK